MERTHNKFLSQLSTTDEILHKVVMKQGVILLPTTDTPFRNLIRIITGQQLSVKAADTIYKRVENHLGIGYSPESVLNTDDSVFRSLGLSRSKTSYVKAVAEAAGPDCSNFDEFNNLTNGEVLKRLIAIRGIGLWSAQMYLMFHLCRTDVFAPGDYGLRKAMSKLYGYDTEGKDAIWEERAAIWAPYRTFASLHLWKYLDNK
ncbi:MAG TPA: DNA-3-methyladenine glycosylase 2 family protein [Flavobacteriales bacterium]|nr:DNA-3-methyladenine glycosylase 2 family protein [Flavobacteriales bacterium]HIB78342.1 DNA-3-methyladenine glycosylase 2 family protein [Flavobacteriales bacterium]HIN41575.1 DNA-3-methyladenine glycosylase 2 family protein [Flavobacteriales bacterium]HIO16183.1 DNA-3-methyladenine glycosylase 2 family protein [Flavobacteriales bacterium]